MHLLREGPHMDVGMVQTIHGRRLFVLSRWSGRCMQDPMLTLFVEALGQCVQFRLLDIEESSYNDRMTTLGM